MGHCRSLLTRWVGEGPCRHKQPTRMIPTAWFWMVRALFHELNQSASLLEPPERSGPVRAVPIFCIFTKRGWDITAVSPKRESQPYLHCIIDPSLQCTHTTEQSIAIWLVTGLTTGCNPNNHIMLWRSPFDCSTNNAGPQNGTPRITCR